MSNGSSSTELEPPLSEVPLALRIVHAVIVASLLVISLVGNTVALFLVVKYRKLRYRSIVVSMGVVVVDLLIPFFLHFQALASSIAGRWPFEQIGCTVLGYILISLIYVRWMEMAVIAIDRLLRICFPFFYDRWSKHILITLTVIAWMVPFIGSLPSLFGFGPMHFRSTLTHCAPDCGSNNPPCVYFYTIQFGLYLLIGALLPTMVYLMLYCMGRKKRRAMRRRLGTQTSTGISNGIVSNMDGGRRAELSLEESSMRERDRRAFVTFVTVFIALLFTQMPLYFVAVTRRTAFYQKIPIYVHYIFLYIYLLSPVLDPIVIMRNRDFRHALSHLMGRRRSVSAEYNHGTPIAVIAT